MNNKQKAIAVAIIGLFLAVYMGAYLAFYLPIKTIISSISIVDAKLVISEYVLAFNLFKLLISGFVFAILVNVSANVSTTLWNSDEN